MQILWTDVQITLTRYVDSFDFMYTCLLLYVHMPLTDHDDVQILCGMHADPIALTSLTQPHLLSHAWR